MTVCSTSSFSNNRSFFNTTLQNSPNIFDLISEMSSFKHNINYAPNIALSMHHLPKNLTAVKSVTISRTRDFELSWRLQLMYCFTVLPFLPHRHIRDAQQAVIPCLTHGTAISRVTLNAPCVLHVFKQKNYCPRNWRSRLLVQTIIRLYQQIRGRASYACYIKICDVMQF